MPFKPIRGRGKGGQRMYRSPSGRKFTAKQVKMYYARGGSFKQRSGRASRKSK